MEENKKSFIAYSDWKETFDVLPDEKAGQLIKHIFSYVNDENPITDDILINAVFVNIKNTLKRDLKKWEAQYNQRVSAGKKSAEVRKQNAAVVNARSISSTVSDTVSDTVSVNEKKTINIEFDVFWNLYNKKIARVKCEPKWNKLTNEEREKIINTLPDFISNIRDKQYQPNPEKYINQRRWEDEIIKTNQDEKTEQSDKFGESRFKIHRY